MKYHQSQAGISYAQLEPFIRTLAPYQRVLAETSTRTTYLEPESSVSLPFDSNILNEVNHLCTQVQSRSLQYIVLIGIGGSNLGTQAVYEAIAGSMHLLVDRLPKILFLDTVTDEKMTAVTRILERCTDKDDFLVITISKSGTTTETIANTEVLWAFAQEHFGNVHDRFVCLTDEGSKLWTVAHEKKFICARIPENVGGRFSVFSMVGLLPLSLAGIDIEELLKGARQAITDATSSEDPEQNPALTSACTTFFHAEQGRTIHNTFLFSPKFEALGKWYRQLMAESIGKENKGITPIVSIGSTDLHSMAQLYWGGRDDKLTRLVYSFTGAVHSTPHHLALPGLIENIHSTSLESIMQAIYGGVTSAYTQANRPFVEINLERADAYELGYYLQFNMVEMMYLGKLMGVNTFDQPAVELYKSVTRDLLQR